MVFQSLKFYCVLWVLIRRASVFISSPEPKSQNELLHGWKISGLILILYFVLNCLYIKYTYILCIKYTYTLYTLSGLGTLGPAVQILTKLLANMTLKFLS